VAIIERADRMGDDAQTALLKTLEEPPAGVAIVLCADDEDRLMPTVRSRCARIRLGPVASREIEALLDEADLADAPVAARLARMSGGRPGLARSLARAPDAVAARDEIARTLLDLIRRGPADRLVAARELATRVAELDRLMQAATEAESGSIDGSGRPDQQGPSGAGRGGRRKGRLSAAGGGRTAFAVVSAPEPTAAIGAADEATDEPAPDGAGPAETGAPSAAPAAERRRAAAVLIGLWREVARDLFVVRLGAERDVRDPGLLDDLRAAAMQLGAEALGAGPRAIEDRDLVARRLAAFLGRLDSAGELLESNVRAELVLDTLMLAWPAAPTTEEPVATRRSGR
jgi:hypothetical protein